MVFEKRNLFLYLQPFAVNNENSLANEKRSHWGEGIKRRGLWAKEGWRGKERAR